MFDKNVKSIGATKKAAFPITIMARFKKKW